MRLLRKKKGLTEEQKRALLYNLGLLVGHELVDKWKYVADKISETINMSVYVIHD
jgi:hypothetical protein